MPDEHVRRTGTIFRCGDYADKGFALTPDEAKAAIAAFTPVPVDLEHTSTVLDNRLGTLESVAMHSDGTSLVGTVALPKWLDDLLDDGTRKVSATWDKATKQLRGLAIVNTPRVADAALFAAFSATDEGKRLVAIESEFVGKRNSASDQQVVQTMHDHAVTLGAECPTQVKMSKETDMDDAKKIGVFDTLKALFGGGDIAPVVPATPAVTPKETVPMSTTTTPAADVETPREKQMRAELDALKAQFSTSVEAGTQTRAQQYADAAIHANRAYPAQRDSLTALFAQAIRDDAANAATITFGATDADKGGRLDALVALVKATPAHTLTTETIPENISVLFGAPEKGSKKDDIDKDVEEAREWGKKNLRKDA